VIKVKERDTLTSNRGPDLNLADPPFNAQERDIDLMLLEEIHCEPTFLAWIAEQAGISNGSLVQARHSVYRGNGETDVLVFVDTPKGRTALMVEDKIGAEMQPRQAERCFVHRKATFKASHHRIGTRRYRLRLSRNGLSSRAMFVPGGGVIRSGGQKFASTGALPAQPKVP